MKDKHVLNENLLVILLAQLGYENSAVLLQLLVTAISRQVNQVHDDVCLGQRLSHIGARLHAMAHAKNGVVEERFVEVFDVYLAGLGVVLRNVFEQAVEEGQR